MKKNLALPALAVIGGAAAFVLRLAQNRTGFEADTGLPVGGNFFTLALPAVLAAVVVVTAFLTCRLPKGEHAAFPADFSTEDPRFLLLPVAGALLMALSGLMRLAESFGLFGAVYTLTADGLEAAGSSPQVSLLTAVLTLACAAGTLLSAAACRLRAGKSPAFSTAALLVCPAALVVDLVLAYRADSINPALEAYYVDLLALVFLALAFYRLSSFGFQSGNTRRFALYTVPAAVMSCAAAADAVPNDPAGGALYLGVALALLGFLLLRLASAPHGAHDSTAPD